MILLTGFLGSGKTTLLNRALGHPAFQDTAIVVNEFGEIGLDHLLVASAKENIVLTEAGCLCCAVIDSLPETLADLYGRRARGETPAFRRLVIETTGLADPGPIVATLLRDPVISRLYRFQAVVCTVDAQIGASTLDNHAEARAQVATADRLALTKTDLTGGVAPESLKLALRAINPGAEMVQALNDPSALFATPASGWSRTVVTPVPPRGADAHGGHEGRARHADAITSQSVWVDDRATWAGVDALIRSLRSELGDRLLRCKGLLSVVGEPGPVLLQGVGAAFATERLETWPDAERRSRIVLIGRDLPRDLLREQAGLLLADAGLRV